MNNKKVLLQKYGMLQYQVIINMSNVNNKVTIGLVRSKYKLLSVIWPKLKTNICLSLCLSVCLSVCLKVCLSVGLLVRSLRVSLSSCLSDYLSVCLKVCVSVSLLVSLYFCLRGNQFVCLYKSSLSIYMSVCLSFHGVLPNMR